MPDINYDKEVTVYNDTTEFGGLKGPSAYYTPEGDKKGIHLNKGNVSWEDFGIKNAPQVADVSLQIIHEAQHQINRESKHVGSAVINLNENYQRDVHDEITALIAEKLEIRRQYLAAKTSQEKEAVLKKFEKNDEHKAYIDAIKKGKINPNSKSCKDFDKEMAFIKEDATTYRADPSDDGYRRQWMSLNMQYLYINGEKIHSNPAAMKKEIHAMYQIGGIDFTKYGNHRDFVLENQSVVAADNFLKQGAAPEKIIAFINEGEGSFSLAESLDVSGLSREQAEKVLQTAIVTQEISENIAGDLCMGENPTYDFNYLARALKEKTAVYLDLKSDIWKKNNILSEQGDTEKFERLMKQAKTVQLDTKRWYQEMKGHIRQDESSLKEIANRVKELQGKTVNLDETVTNINNFKLPLDGTSKEEVLAEKERQAKEQEEFLREYNKKNPPEKKRVSDPYKIKIMDLEAPILKDDLTDRQKAEEEAKKKAEEEAKRRTEEETRKKAKKEFPTESIPETDKEKKQKISSLTPTPVSYSLADGGIIINLEECHSAELLRQKNENGELVDFTLLDGKKHGLFCIMDEQGNIKSYKLYNKGKELDISKHKIDIKKETRPDGSSWQAVMLDGKKFGTELYTAPNGIQKAGFYAADGNPIFTAKDAQISQHGGYAQTPSVIPNNSPDELSGYALEASSTDKEKLKAEMKNQQGELPKPNASALNYTRFTLRLATYKPAQNLPLLPDTLMKQDVPTLTPVWSNKKER